VAGFSGCCQGILGGTGCPGWPGGPQGGAPYCCPPGLSCCQTGGGCC
jgi:hypothetical protein